MRAMDQPLSAADVEPGLRMAATVILVRDGGDGPEVCLLRRHHRSGFAADAWVFPGGAVDAADRRLDPDLWDGIEPERLAGRFSLPADLVLGLHVAAVRETWEEAGVLLARDRDGRPATAPDAGRRPPDLPGWLRRRALVLDLGALEYWSRWVTPRAEPRRYDACFFLAAAPPGQAARHDGAETTDQRWMTPRGALDEASAGRLRLAYPTRSNLAELASVGGGHRQLTEYAAARPEVRRILPHAERSADGRWRVIHPDEPGYPGEPGHGQGP